MGAASFVRASFQGGEFSQAMQGRLDDPRYHTALSACLNGFPIEEGAWVRRPGTQYVMALPGPGRVWPFAFPNSAPYTMIFTDEQIQFMDGTRIVAEVTTPYIKGSLSDWTNVRIVQTDNGTDGSNTAVLLNGSSPQVVLAFGATDFTAGPLSFWDGPYLDIPIDETVLTPSGLSGTITITLSGGGAGNTTKFTPDTDVGRHVRIFSIPPLWSPSTTYHNGNTVFYAGNVYTFENPSGGTTSGSPPTSGPAQYFPSASPPGFYGWQLIPQAAIWGWGIITAVASTTVATLALASPLLYTNSTPYFRLGAYSNTTGWPTCGCFHEGRLWLSGAIGNRIDASVSALPLPDPLYGPLVAFSNPVFVFSPTDFYGTVADSNGITATFRASDTNQIYWMEPDQQGILCGTRGGEWLVQATAQNLPLTPTSIQAHRYTKIKCANIPPVRCNLTLVFVQLFQRKIIEYFADVFSGRMTGPNLSETAKHLMINFIEEMAYQQETNPVLWARDGAGNLLGCSYKRESLMSREKPTYAGWHRHQLGTGRKVVSLCVSGNATGLLDALVMVTSDGASYWVEMLGDTVDEDATSPADYNFLDGSTFVTHYADQNGTALQLAGLSYLTGKTVTVWAGGLDTGDYTVASDGTISVPYGDGLNTGANGTNNYTGTTQPGGGSYLFTKKFVDSFAAMPIHVGFTYTSQGQLTRPQASQETGARNGPGFGKMRRNHQAAIQVVNTQGLSIGTSFTLPNQMYPVAERNKRQKPLKPNQLFSGIHWVESLGDDYSFDGQICWQATRPYPATIAAIGGFLETQDK